MVVGNHANGRRLLDIGAGVGTFLSLARRVGFVVLGTEVSHSAVSIARSAYAIDLLHGQLEDLEVPPGSTDVITMWHVLEHLPFPRTALQACFTGLRSGGVLIVAVPNDSAVRHIFASTKARVVRLPYERYAPLTAGREIHLSHFRPATLSRLLESVGFVVRGVAIDDHYPEPSAGTKAKIAGLRAVLRVTGINLGQALLAIAHKPMASSG
jgi:SAM-dependent methyltransferase